MAHERSISQKITIAIVGLLSINFVVLVHELGHFILAKLFGVGTPVFSIGFGPQLAAYQIGDTLFQIALLPIGGYVAMDPAGLEARSYLVNMAILSAGVLFNFLLSYAIIAYLTSCISCNNQQREEARASRFRMRDRLIEFLHGEGYDEGAIGPLGIIGMLGKSILISRRMFLLVLAILSFNIGMFNLIPLPFLDGGQMATLTIERLMGKFGGAGSSIPSLLLFALIALIIIAKAVRNARQQ